MDFDFIDGNKGEVINFDLAGYSATPSLSGNIGELSLQDKKEWRFQQRQQQFSAIRVGVSAVALDADFDSLRFVGSFKGPITMQSHQVSDR